MILASMYVYCFKDHYDGFGELALRAGQIYKFTEHSRSAPAENARENCGWKYPVTVDTPTGKITLPPEDAGACISHTTNLNDVFRLHYYRGELQIEPVQSYDGYLHYALVSEHGQIDLGPWDHPVDNIESTYNVRKLCVTASERLHWVCYTEFNPPEDSSEDLESALELLRDVEAHPASQYETLAVQEAVYTLEENIGKAKIREAGLDLREEFHKFLIHYAEDHLRDVEETEERE